MSTPMRDENAQRAEAGEAAAPEIGRKTEPETGQEAGPPRNLAAGPSFVFTDDERPWPPRFWWLKRLSVAGVVLLLALVGVRWWWGVEAERRLAARITEAQARGEPVTLEDFQRLERDIPDERNAAYFYMRAFEALPPFTPALNIPPEEQPDNASGHPDLVYPGAQLENYAETLRLVREARDLTEVDWGVRLSSPVVDMLIPHLSLQRHLAKVLSDVAVVHHQQGDDGAAVDILFDGFAQAQALGVRPFGLIGALIRSAVEALFIDVVERIAPTLKVTTFGPEDHRYVSCDMAHELIALLLNEEQFWDGNEYAVQFERMVQLDGFDLVFDHLANVRGIERVTSWYIRPAFVMDAAFGQEFFDAGRQALHSRAFPDVINALRPYLHEFESSIGFKSSSRLLSSISAPSFERALTIFHRTIAMRRMAATALAIRLYEIDHGERPMALEDLVPQYLPAVPIDSFAPEDTDSERSAEEGSADGAERRGRPIQYLRDAPRPLLYSVGPDGIDDGGRFELQADGAVNWEAGDLVFFLDGDRPRGR